MRDAITERPHKTVTVSRLVELAGQLNEEIDLGVHAEYTRGQVSLICEAAGLGEGDRAGVERAVAEAARRFYGKAGAKPATKARELGPITLRSNTTNYVGEKGEGLANFMIETDMNSGSKRDLVVALVITDTLELKAGLGREVGERLVACWNACSEMDDPAHCIHKLRDMNAALGKTLEETADHWPELLGAAEEAFGALVGANAADDSVQGRARARLRKILSDIKNRK